MLAQAQPVPASTPAFFAMRFDMSTEQEDIAYYRRRIAACHALAAAATCLSARRAHEALAQLYAEQLLMLERDLPVGRSSVAKFRPSEAGSGLPFASQESADGIPSA